MKYFVTPLMLVLTALMAQAQTNNSGIYTYRQKLLNNSLRMLLPDPQTNIEVPLQDNTPALRLKNEGAKTGSNNLGDIYSMKTDNMPCLKPFKTKDEIPNAMNQNSIVSVVPKQKK